MNHLLELNGINKKFSREGRTFLDKKESFYAVENVNLHLDKGEILGLVGESGCGKSTMAGIIVRLVKEDSGNIYFNGEDITNYRGRKLRELRKNIQIVFQDTYGSLNPSKKIGWLLKETLDINTDLTEKEKEYKTEEMLNLVGLSSVFKNRYPYELSGGERQRVGIGQALMLRPKIVIADEAVSALDVSVQSQILNLMMDLKQQLDLSYIFISHDLNVIYYLSDRIAVMKDGKIVETGNAEDIFYKPKESYTKLLFNSIPMPAASVSSGGKRIEHL